jgi:hypothetical protein
MMKGAAHPHPFIIHRRFDASTTEDRMQDDRSSNVGGEHGPVPARDHAGERDPRLSAKSLAARGDAPDGSEDGRDAARQSEETTEE